MFHVSVVPPVLLLLYKLYESLNNEITSLSGYNF